mmetsp:Transcript_50862/g.119190  ORF Transcript_50862/g.119190 Transcript_50862/m.119190 type:complete len:323 (+) Transcript_50862:1069-2037(+)
MVRCRQVHTRGAQVRYLCGVHPDGDDRLLLPLRPRRRDRTLPRRYPRTAHHRVARQARLRCEQPLRDQGLPQGNRDEGRHTFLGHHPRGHHRQHQEQETLDHAPCRQQHAISPHPKDDITRLGTAPPSPRRPRVHEGSPRRRQLCLFPEPRRCPRVFLLRSSSRRPRLRLHRRRDQASHERCQEAPPRPRNWHFVALSPRALPRLPRTDNARGDGRVGTRTRKAHVARHIGRRGAGYSGHRIRLSLLLPNRKLRTRRLLRGRLGVQRLDRRAPGWRHTTCVLGLCSRRKHAEHDGAGHSARLPRCWLSLGQRGAGGPQSAVW